MFTFYYEHLPPNANVTATGHLLTYRGLLDYSEYVHKYWPEFRRFGKENVTLGMLLSHQVNRE